MAALPRLRRFRESSREPSPTAGSAATVSGDAGGLRGKVISDPGASLTKSGGCSGGIGSPRAPLVWPSPGRF